MIDCKNHILCPSSKCEEGAILLGIVQGDGHVGFVNQKLVVNKEFVDVANNGRSPEKRFRFSNSCANTSCKQWKGDRCGVIDRVIGLVGNIDEPKELPHCSIRDQCRWYQQCGGRACSVCPEIITDLRPV